MPTRAASNIRLPLRRIHQEAQCGMVIAPSLKNWGFGGNVMTQNDYHYMIFVVAAVLVLTALASWVFLEAIS